MSNSDIITFYVYSDGVVKHTYEPGNIKYEVVALYPKTMCKEILKLANEYKMKFQNSTVNTLGGLSVVIVDSLSVRRSAFKEEYGVIGVKN